MTAKAKDTIALERSNQSALNKAVKKYKKGKGKLRNSNDEGPSLGHQRGIIVLKHIPHGFFEDEIKGYFSQFGKVLQVRVARSLKTGKSRGYAYVEFEFEEVAKIAAESMNNYLMFERLIKCELLPPSVNRRKLFKDSYVREHKNPKVMARNKQLAEQDRILSQEEESNILELRRSKLKEQNKRLAEMGINYSFKLTEPVAKKAKIEEPTVKVKAKSPMASVKTPLKSLEMPVKSPKTPVLMMDKKKKMSLEMQPSSAPKAKTPKQSPEMPKKKKSLGMQMAPTTGPHADEKKGKTPEKTKFSPKLLRSRKSQGPQQNVSTTPLAKKDKESDKKGKKQVQRPSEDRFPEKIKEKMPKFSPKLLRSRKSEGHQQQTPVSGSQAKKGRAKGNNNNASELPRVSPKMLRSRKSEAAALTPLKDNKSTPVKAKKVGRKSVF